MKKKSCRKFIEDSAKGKQQLYYDVTGGTIINSPEANIFQRYDPPKYMIPDKI